MARLNEYPMDGWKEGRRRTGLKKKIANFEDAVAAWLNHEIRARFQVSLTLSVASKI